ncbi:MAG: enoyl-CoA hydratase/isomerase family protein [Candidatus Lokiarchaeota archaeon]|nr:enoyl-CoA hydratase/isomerase family protein [Candidatus Lokiarchaeota archaeon]
MVATVGTNILVEKKGRVGLVTMNRPEVKNAFDEQARKDFRDVLRELRQDKAIRVIILTGAGDSFSTGQDLKSMYGTPPDRMRWLTDFGRLMILEIMTGNEYDDDPKEFWDALARNENPKFEISEKWKPVIAQVNGYAMGGGCEIACACDFRFAGEMATFQLPEIDMRLFPAWGGTQTAVNVLGVPAAKHFIFTGEKITAQRAREIGLVHGVFKDADLPEEVLRFAKALTQKHPETLRFAKILLDKPRGAVLLRGLALEHEYLWKLS